MILVGSEIRIDISEVDHKIEKYRENLESPGIDERVADVLRGCIKELKSLKREAGKDRPIT
jgi:hypothetical protein